MAPPSLDLIRSTRGTLLRFYDTRRRALPWRAQPEPYGVWISEVMLQQTRVDAVLPYYRAWMERFPDLATLARAGVDDVLRAWEGLGYYARARNLHRAALMVRDRFGGELPASAAGLRELPRVGEYTAGAVASIAYGEVVSAVDGNVRRVMARLFDEREPTTSWLRERAGALVDPERPGDFNQALMDLGATVCTARAPVCGVCPLAPDCLARRRGAVAECPRPRRRAPLPVVEVGVAVLLRQRAGSGLELLLARRAPDGLLGGLWELPGETVGSGEDAAAERAALRAGVNLVGPGTSLAVVRQVYSHFRGVFRPFLWRVPAEDHARFPGTRRETGWVDAAGLAALALLAAQDR